MTSNEKRLDAMIQPAKRQCIGCGEIITRTRECWWEDADGFRACPNSTGVVALEHQPGELTFPKDSAGPADLRASASPSGTGGTVDTAVTALLDAVNTLTSQAETMARQMQARAEEIEGRQRELWDALINAARLAEIGGGPASATHAGTLQYAYHLVSGNDGPALEKLVAAELDVRYGADRAKGGEPRG